MFYKFRIAAHSRIIPVFLVAMVLAGCEALPHKTLMAPLIAPCDVHLVDDRPYNPNQFLVQHSSASLNCPAEAPVTRYVEQALCRAGVAGRGTLTALEIRSTGMLEVWKFEGHITVQMDDGRRIRAIISRDDPEDFSLTGWLCENAMNKYLVKLEAAAKNP